MKLHMLNLENLCNQRAVRALRTGKEAAFRIGVPSDQVSETFLLYTPFLLFFVHLPIQ